VGSERLFLRRRFSPPGVALSVLGLWLGLFLDQRNASGHRETCKASVQRYILRQPFPTHGCHRTSQRSNDKSRAIAVDSRSSYCPQQSPCQIKRAPQIRYQTRRHEHHNLPSLLDYYTNVQPAQDTCQVRRLALQEKPKIAYSLGRSARKYGAAEAIAAIQRIDCDTCCLS
jgi:hypothetical protein